MQTKTKTKTKALHFDIHGRVMLRVEADAPAAAQLQSMLACFATDTERPADILVDDRLEPMPEAGLVEHELAYTENSVRFQADRVQVVRDAKQWRIHGPGELLTSVVPVLDAAMVGRGAGMIHAATMAYRGHAIALPAAGGTGKTSTAAKLMRREGWSFMGDDWAFLAEDATLLGYAKPMFIKPHHRAILPAPVRRRPEAPGPLRSSRRASVASPRWCTRTSSATRASRTSPGNGRRSTVWSTRGPRSPGVK